MSREVLNNTGRGVIDQLHQKVVYPYLTHGEGEVDREIAHDRALRLMELFQKAGLLNGVVGKLFTFEDKILETNFAGVCLRSPVGIAAGFDKNGRVIQALKPLGPAYTKGGSFCLLNYGGNGGVRVHHLIEDDALINNMGFPGEGAGVEERLKKLNSVDKNKPDYRVVISIAASKPSFEQGNQIEHYVEVARRLLPYGDWHEVNVSSPNTDGVTALQEPEVFRDLAQAIMPIYREKGKGVSFKFGADLEYPKLIRNVRTARDLGALAVTLVNTTKESSIREDLRSPHKNQEGAISGAPLTQKALEINHRVNDDMGGEMMINRSGGVMNVRDTWDALTYGGAELVDVLSVFVLPKTSTPNFFYYHLRHLAQAMRAYGLESMEDFKELRGRKVPFPSI